MKTQVYLTIDTENSMGGAWSNPSLRPVPADRRIFCNIDGESYGIGWLCRELNERKLKATFFGEVFSSLLFGEDETRRWFDYLTHRGQDVQLHTHLTFYYYALFSGSRRAKTDDLAELQDAERREVLDRACDLFYRLAGYAPLAYRAGNWRGTRALLRDLASRRIVVDASFNRALHGRGSYDNETLAVNTLQLVEGVWVLPVTVGRQSLADPAITDGLRPLDPTSLSRWEIRKLLDDAHSSGSTHVSAVLHSFSGIKPKNAQYTSLKPDHVVRGRFRFLLDYLCEHSERFSVCSLADLAKEVSTTAVVSTTGSVSQLGLFHPLARKFVQAANRW